MKPQVVCLAILLGAPTSQVRAELIIFEGRADGEAVTNQYIGQGVTFTQATALLAGQSLNEFEFPPRSGVTVVGDAGGPISGNFTAPVTSVGGYFTYTVPITLTAFAGPDGTGGAVGLVTSAFGSNLALSGDPGSTPNELLHIDFAGGIRSFTVTGAAGGSSFTLDDFTFRPADTTAVPGPSSLALLGAGAAGLAGWRLRRWRAM